MNQHYMHATSRPHQPFGPTRGQIGRAKRVVGRAADLAGLHPSAMQGFSNKVRSRIPDQVAYPINRLFGSPSPIVTAQDFVPLHPRFEGSTQRHMTADDVRQALSISHPALMSKLTKLGYNSAAHELRPNFDDQGRLVLTPSTFELGQGRFSRRDALSNYVNLTPELAGLAVRCLTELEGYSEADFLELLNVWATYQLVKTGTQVVIEGWDQLPKDEQFVFAPTHFANIEYGPLFLLLSIMGCNMSIVLKDDLTRNKFTGEIVGLRDLFHTFNNIFIEINRKDCKTAKQIIEKTAGALKAGGTSNIIYPSGTRNKKRWDARGHRIDGNLPDKLKSGVWYLAQGSGLRVVPISTNGVGRAAGRDEWDPTQTGQVIRLLIGKPVSIDDFPSKEAFLAYLQDFYMTHSEDHIYSRER